MFVIENGDELVKYNGDEKIVVVPAGIRKIGFEAFGKNEPGKSALETVILPDGLEEIGMSAFAFCDQLQFVNLPDSLIKIDNSAFWSCKKLTEIRIPEVWSISGRAHLKNARPCWIFMRLTTLKKSNHSLLIRAISRRNSM